MLRVSENRTDPCRHVTVSRGFSLIEILIVLAVLGIVTGAVLTFLQSTVNDQLDAAAQVVASDLYYIRNLSVSNNSTYLVTFASGTSQYYFEHSGANAALDILPPLLHGVTKDSPTRQSTDINLVSVNASSMEVAAVYVLTPTPMDVTDLEFGPLGETTRSEETIIWLAAGLGDARRYVPLSVNPVTGNTKIGKQTTTLPFEIASGEGGNLNHRLPRYLNRSLPRSRTGPNARTGTLHLIAN